MVMDWLELNKGKMDGVEYIEIDQLDILQALDDALIEIYLCYEESKVISLNINNITLVFDRCANPQGTVFQVYGRKYSAGYNVFLKSFISLGEISTDEWTDFVSFYTYLTPYLEDWMDTLHK